MSRRKASVYSIPSNHARQIAQQIAYLAERNRAGDIRGMTYVITNQHDEIELGSTGTHSDTSKAIGALFKASTALTSVA